MVYSITKDLKTIDLFQSNSTTINNVTIYDSHLFDTFLLAVNNGNLEKSMTSWAFNTGLGFWNLGTLVLHSPNNCLPLNLLWKKCNWQSS